MFYSVCKQCTFLRAFSSRAESAPAPERCPACGGEMIGQNKSGRFQPTYVAKVALDLHSSPALQRTERAH
jgi:hypothetical protein